MQKIVGVCASERAMSCAIGKVKRLPAANAGMVRLLKIFSIICLFGVNPVRAAFFTPGQFDVGPSGAASYTVPIIVPPGTGGMAPSLALTYNSQGGNGLLGMGWNLSGLSAITRCPQTLVQDGNKSGINYDVNDKLCLDGQRLVAIAGAYGANGTEYRTEGESYSKVVSYGSNGYGPTSFKVWTKSGQIIEFGNTADSAIEAQGKVAIRVWGVNKVSDTKGNYLTVTYTEVNANGEYYPNRIDYTGNANAGLVPYNSVRFVYAARPDITPLYDGGSLIKITVRLTNVQSWAPVNGVDAIVKDYRLTYDVSAATQRSRITQVQECDGAGTTCLLPTTLGWQDGGVNFAPAAEWGNNNYWAGVDWKGFADFNGDGKVDFWYVPPGTSQVLVRLSTGTSLASATEWSNGTIWAGVAWKGFADFNGDGKADFWYVPNNTSQVMVKLSTGAGFTAATEWSNGTIWAGPGWFGFNDFSGDGRPDFWYVPNNTSQVMVKLSTGASFASATEWSNGTIWAGPGWFGFNDFNGDGRPDFWYVPPGTSQVMVKLSTGASFASATEWSNGTIWAGVAWKGFADFNGDGKADFWYVPNNTSQVMVKLSTGTSLASATEWSNGTIWAGPGWFGFNDFNGDGRLDFWYVPNNTSQVMVKLSTGASFASATEWSNGTIWAGPGWFGFDDVNGDGRLDFWYVPNNTSQVLVRPGNSPFPDFFSTVANGLGATTSITYKPLTDSAVYSKDNGAVYPVVDIQAPLYVVSSVSSSNGIGGNYVSNYSYVGAKSHLTGGGFLGFRQTLSTDAQTGIVSTTTYRQDYPYQGLPQMAEKRTSTGALLNNVVNAWTTTTNPVWSVQYHTAQIGNSVESSYELTGGLISTVTTSTAYDAYGNPTGITVSTPEGYSKTTVNTYDNSPTTLSNWYLGRLINATVSSTTP